VVLIVVGIALVATLGGVWGGPALGDHEALVAQCARQMRVSGDWVVPRFQDTPFLRKPPLGYWLVAATSYLFADDPVTGLPVTAVVARLPSALAGLVTVLLIWKLALRMYGASVGRVAAFLAATSVFTLLYSPNATVEMLLTMCCTWSALHFWFAVTSRTATRRFVHMMMFYVALGAGMLAKGPAPLALVAVPLALWWYTESAQRVLADRHPGGVRRAAVVAIRALGVRSVRAFTRLWLVPGVIVFLAVFVPWMIAVARRNEFAWDMWNWQYLQRFQGDYEDTRHRGYFYYIPMVLGLLLPWTPALAVGLVAPWIRTFRRRRRALYFAGCWAVGGVLVMSLMEFKKPYYILPTLPAFILLIAPIVESFVRPVIARARAVGALGIIGVLGLLLAAGLLGIRSTSDPGQTTYGYIFVGVLGTAALAWSVALQWRRRYAETLLTIGCGMTCAFCAGWYALGPRLANIDRTALLDQKLDVAHIPSRGPLFWVDQRPDARLIFYYNRWSAHLIAPAEIVEHSIDRTHESRWLQETALQRVGILMAGHHAVYMILDRKHLDLLDRLPPAARSLVRVLGTIDPDRHPDGEDWVVIANVSGA
jgi:4-amino-4-deoxy-L-arabinose transferase-like glycosyltransferase